MTYEPNQSHSVSVTVRSLLARPLYRYVCSSKTTVPVGSVPPYGKWVHGAGFAGHLVVPGILTRLLVSEDSCPLVHTRGFIQFSPVQRHRYLEYRVCVPYDPFAILDSSTELVASYKERTRHASYGSIDQYMTH
jgi:hypothetical protein